MTKTNINYTDNLAPMPNSQDFLSENLMEETENICAAHCITDNIDKNQALLEEEFNKTASTNMEKREPIVYKDFLVNGNSCEINLSEMMQFEHVNQCSNEINESNCIYIGQTYEIQENQNNVTNENPQQSNPIPVACETDQMIARKALAPLLMVPPTQPFNDTLSTPQIVNDVLEMDQKDQFDLINYIDSVSKYGLFLYFISYS